MTDSDKTLEERLAALPTSVSPPTELWGKIEAHLEQPASSHSIGTVPRRTYAVAAAALFVAVTLGVVQLYSDKSSRALEVASYPATSGGDIDHLQVVAVRNDLHEALALALDDLSPQTRDIVFENLARIDAARKEIDAALQQEPNNKLLKKMLLSSYTNEISLLGEFTAMAESAPQRTRL